MNEALSKELAVLEKAIDIAEKKKNRAMATDIRVMNMLTVVRRFVERKGRLLYGGMAINFLLPEADRFQDPEQDVPDYDFMTPNGARDAIELADEFHRLGYPNVEVKPALHVGTLKVQVDFVAVADITTVARRFQSYLKRDSVVVDGLRFVGPSYLRMSMYLELSRPMGDVSRWTKVFKRLRLLDAAHPFDVPACPESAHYLDGRKTPNLELQELLAKFARNNRLVLMGDMALNVLRSINKKGDALRIPARGTQYIFLSERGHEDVNLLSGFLNGIGQNPDIKEHARMGELVPIHWEIRIKIGKDVFTIFIQKAEFGCHSYYKLQYRDGEELRVASVQTILSFYLAFVMTGRKYHDNKKLLCISRELTELAERLFVSSRPPFLGFPVLCVGKQPQREDMMAERNEKSAELKEAGDEAEQLKVFLSYNPAKTGDAKRKRAIIAAGTAPSPKGSQRYASVRKSLKKNTRFQYVPKSGSRKTSKRVRD